MLSGQAIRQALRAAPRAAYRPATVTPLASRAARTFTTSIVRRDPESVNEKHINVTSYKDGARAEEVLPVSEKNEPVAPPGQDIQATAQPLNLDVIPQLTPTVVKFLLPGKVAVVTG